MSIVRREFIPSARRINGLEIYFVNKSFLQVRDGKACVLFHRWFIKKGFFYKESWKPFCDKLKHSKSIKTIWDAMDLANRYGISMQSPVKPYNPPEYLFGKQVHSSRNNDHKTKYNRGKTLYDLIKEAKG